MQNDFIYDIEEIVIKEIDRVVTKLVRDDFVTCLVGDDWEQDNFKGLLDALRGKAKRGRDMDLLIMYLFAEIVNDRRITFSWMEYPPNEDFNGNYGEDFSNFVRRISECTGIGDEIHLYGEQGSMTAKLGARRKKPAKKGKKKC